MESQEGRMVEAPLQTTFTPAVHSSRAKIRPVVQAASSRDNISKVGTSPISSPSARTLPTKSLLDMQPPPAKRQRVHNFDRRPRLSICPSVSPDPDLVEDRDRNDNTLKGKFEAIFEKYGRDFTDIGDEINLITGEVIVDHGHILSMVDEKDPGSPSRAKPRVSREPTEISTSTPVPQDEQSIMVGAEDVIARIEAMARGTVTRQTLNQDDEENDGDEAYASSKKIPYRSNSVSSDSLLGDGRDDYQNEWQSQRFGSRHSLLQYEEQDSSIESSHDDQALLPLLPFSTSGSKDRPIVLTSGPILPPTPDLDGFTASWLSPHKANSPRPPSASVFVKSNGQKKVVRKKINVSKVFEELQRQASSTPAITSSHCDAHAVTASKLETTAPPVRLQPSSRKAKSIGRLHEAVAEVPATRDVTSVLKRLPVPRPSSEPLTAEYESDDPLQ